MITLDNENSAELIGLARQLESKIDESCLDIANSIVLQFQALTTLNPEVSLNLLEQLNEQITLEKVNEMIEENEAIIDNFIKLIHRG